MSPSAYRINDSIPKINCSLYQGSRFQSECTKKQKNSAKNIPTYTSPDGNCMSASPTRWYHNQQSKYRIDLFVLPIYTSDPHIQCLTISTIAELLHMITNTCCWSIEHGSVPGFA